jgi:class 3 adenylate cyclase
VLQHPEDDLRFLDVRGDRDVASGRLVGRFGATVDNYTGDGVLLRFNVPKQVAEHELAAVTAATEMNRAFQDLKEYWVAISPRFASVFNRVGISTGPLLRASLGHSQVQSLTIIGYPISVAAALCEHAARDRNIVMVGEETWNAVKERAIGVEVKPELLGKARAFTRAAYEITALR